MYNLQYALVAFAYFVFIARKLRITYTICTLCFGCNSALISLLYKRLIRNNYYYYYYMYNECYEHVPTNYVIPPTKYWEESYMFQTHKKKKLACSQSFIAFSWVFGSVYVKYVSDAKVKKNSARSLRSLDIIYGLSQVSCFLVCIMNKTISRVLRTQGYNYSTDKHWFIYNVYWEESYMFSTQI